ncbi:unnamed protein product [Sphenostylis stenocarpa]|uniref:Uncharacterized protein n=1 Tax=Sphenostylis stenocarpa TaxID=92480 RepID=A0AA86SP93_9FABA|nr:unnamed protein product [Sphenostylis stenocarpa]
MSLFIEDNSNFMIGMGPFGVVHPGSSFAAGFITGEESSRAAYRDDLAAGEETVRVDLQEEEFQTNFDRVMRGD